VLANRVACRHTIQRDTPRLLRKVKVGCERIRIHKNLTSASLLAAGAEHVDFAPASLEAQKRDFAATIK
jgi:hypothetical protein